MGSSKKIPVIDIERHRIGLDGPGVRTLIGLHGCPLRCCYCLNPHAWDGSSEITYYTPEELYQAVKIDNLYFQTTGGGLTFGGGEPLLHIELLYDFKKLCPDTWSLWAETSLAVSADKVALAAQVFDHFLVDIKTTDENIYKDYTGNDLTMALTNLQWLLSSVGAERITLRLPQIPNFTTKKQLYASEEALRAMGVTDIDHLVYEKDVGI